MAMKRAAFSILVTMIAAAVVHVDTKTSCRLCQPGYHMVRKCKDKQPNTTRCARCPAGSYTDVPNMEKGCYPHRKCNTTSEVMTFPGNTTHDVICKPCDEHTQPCQPCHECPPGKEVKITGGCGICIYGYFSNETSSTQPCRPWTRCHSLGLVTIKEGNSTTDAICGNGILSDPGDTDQSVGKEAIRSSQESTKLDERVLLIVNTLLTALIFFLLLVLGAKKVCKKYEEGDVAFPVQCEDTHPKELEASSSVDSRATTHLLPDQSTRISSSTLSTQVVNEWSPMIPPANVEDLQETETDDQGVCYGFPVADGHHTLPKASSSAHMASQIQQHLPFRPMSCSTDTIPSTSASSHETSASSLEYRQKVNTTLARSYANILTASVTEELKTSLGEQWPELARRLKLKQYQIDQIVNENRSDLQGQIYSMLRCWQDGKTGEATIPELYGALKECNRQDIMQKLQSLEGRS